jgi:hypothetical protein
MDSTRKTERTKGLPAFAAKGTRVAVLLALVTAVGCGARRARLVAWRPLDVTALPGEATTRGARTYRLALPRPAQGERPMRAELVFATVLDGAHVDAVAVDGHARRPLLSRKPAAGDIVVVPLAGTRAEQVEVVLRGPRGAAPPLRTARVATEMPMSWPVALGAESAEVLR